VAQVFQPPVAYDLPRVTADTTGVPYLLMRHYSPLPRGRSVVKTAGVWALSDLPDSTGLVEGTDLFLGGHVYTVSDAVATALTTDGFGAYLGAVPAEPPSTLTWGALAGSTWDEFVDNYGTWG
jgi:hypothetical protein